MFTVRTERTSSSTSDSAAALGVAMRAARDGSKPTLHQFGGRALSVADLAAIAGMAALVGEPRMREQNNVTAQMLGLV